jgi:hypothetical protein
MKRQAFCPKRSLTVMVLDKYRRRCRIEVTDAFAPAGTGNWCALDVDDW